MLLDERGCEGKGGEKDACRAFGLSGKNGSAVNRDGKMQERLVSTREAGLGSLPSIPMTMRGPACRYMTCKPVLPF